jgi:hypothetical protein
VPQAETDQGMGTEYCWTVSGEPNPETYPCWMGPMFTPFSITPPLIDDGFEDLP